jgi:hypothetical protein
MHEFMTFFSINIMLILQHAVDSAPCLLSFLYTCYSPIHPRIPVIFRPM